MSCRALLCSKLVSKNVVISSIIKFISCQTLLCSKLVSNSHKKGYLDKKLVFVPVCIAQGIPQPYFIIELFFVDLGMPCTTLKAAEYIYYTLSRAHYGRSSIHYRRSRTTRDQLVYICERST